MNSKSSKGHSTQSRSRGRPDFEPPETLDPRSPPSVASRQARSTVLSDSSNFTSSNPRATSISQTSTTTDNAPVSSLSNLPPISTVPYLPTPITFHDPLAHGPTFSIDSQVVMVFNGEYITFDFATMEDDPSLIIELLQLTNSERASWLTVACAYRRKGLPNSAIHVLNALLEVLKKCTVSEDSLHPVFLLLSGCETELAREAKRQGKSQDASSHYGRAQKYLYKVYGDPAIASSAKTSKPLESSAKKSVSSDVRKARDKCKILEREIHCLRNKSSQHTQALAEMRSTKRKLLDDLNDERSQRRRIERELKDAEEERDMAKRMETHALDQVKREVESRRRAEDRADTEKRRRQDVENEMANKNPQVLLESIAALCHEVAAGNKEAWGAVIAAANLTSGFEGSTRT
ncbi:hypothetical protein DL96DRAFT_1522579 [Flagelloscypha sp. PMI_526]|nr:hypothetical protein DL96DRAFT_1522579 [Flagelloscypha sp. PMI_526]